RRRIRHPRERAARHQHVRRCRPDGLGARVPRRTARTAARPRLRALLRDDRRTLRTAAHGPLNCGPGAPRPGMSRSGPGRCNSRGAVSTGVPWRPGSCMRGSLDSAASSCPWRCFRSPAAAEATSPLPRPRGGNAGRRTVQRAAHRAPNGDGAFAVEAGVTLRETAGVGATLAGVTLTLTDTAGTPDSVELAAAEAFGTTRVAPRGTLTARRIAATPRLLFALAGVGLRVGFMADGTGRVASAQASTQLSVDVSGDWTGDLLLRDPAGPARLGVLTLDQLNEAIAG